MIIFPLVVGLSLLAQTYAPSGHDSVAGRRLAAGRWSEVFSVGGSSAVLISPGPLLATASLIVVFDYGDKALKAFRPNGQRVWSFGRSGAGPGEFGDVTDLQLGPSGSFWIADASNGRISVVDTAGRLEKTIALRTDVFRIHPNQDGSVVACSQLDFTYSRYGPDGRLGQTVLPVPPGLTGEASLAAESFIASNRRGTGFIVYRWADRFVKVDSLGRVGVTSLAVGGRDFPATIRAKMRSPANSYSVRVDPAATSAALGAAASDDQLFILGRDKSTGRYFLDVYATKDGSYIETRELPWPPSLVAASGSDIVVSVSDPIPRLVGLRWVPSPRKRS